MSVSGASGVAGGVATGGVVGGVTGGITGGVTGGVATGGVVGVLLGSNAKGLGLVGLIFVSTTGPVRVSASSS